MYLLKHSTHHLEPCQYNQIEVEIHFKLQIEHSCRYRGSINLWRLRVLLNRAVGHDRRVVGDGRAPRRFIQPRWSTSGTLSQTCFKFASSFQMLIIYAFYKPFWYFSVLLRFLKLGFTKLSKEVRDTFSFRDLQTLP